MRASRINCTYITGPDLGVAFSGRFLSRILLLVHEARRPERWSRGDQPGKQPERTEEVSGPLVDRSDKKNPPAWCAEGLIFLGVPNRI
jgi:hypothetical protein